ncbi:uncharacterized protein LOC132732495 [Ruditapes philippinarum]|uniref:uncharacterized protein LOC132732495 n=1 Tax=Ruditapes philippinarum TaxID=129788 RepID=UPI00295BEB60|nr:uncharacterized protein LOC132732495 [Ruditapes philippinarum]
MNEQLENLMFQSDRKADFSPRAHLCILTDTLQVTGPLHLMITDLVHTCLSNYFLPHRDAASVSWVKRDNLRQRMVNKTDDNVDFHEELTEIAGNLDDADAVFFINEDASIFIKTHRNSFLHTLATCLKSTPNKILVLDICLKPLNIL